ncbi:MAG TPA: endolytic transglycosylase MltG [Bryobacteraceae bacterium]|nr:endolytic transglycosylase MltG [Bryobacteraceae bacterium]
MRRSLHIAAMLYFLAIIAGIFGLHRLSQPYQGFTGVTFVDVPRGLSTIAIGSRLAEAGVIRSRWEYVAARMARRSRAPKAGEYRFDHPASPMEVFDRIARGDAFRYTLLIPEGKNIFDIGAAAEQVGLFPAARFVKAASSPALVCDLDPKASSLEGYLFPDTYKLSRHTAPEELCRLMTARFREVWRGLGVAAGPHDVVTLASLVEKEGKLSEERPMIAAVFLNRLRIGMKLDCDPTTIYAAVLDGRYSGVIHRSDLDSGNPYNTYQHAGLPPGPIASPGLGSIHAALHPARTEALYFVLHPDGTGSHEFSKDIAAHQKAVEIYRRGLAKSVH